MWTLRVLGIVLALVVVNPTGAVSGTASAAAKKHSTLFFWADRDSPSGVSEIWSVRANGKRPRMLIEDPKADSYNPIASANGKRLFFIRKGAVFVARIDGSRVRRLGPNLVGLQSNAGNRNLARDGSVLFTTVDPPTLVLSDPSGKNQRTIIPGGIASNWRLALAPNRTLATIEGNGCIPWSPPCSWLGWKVFAVNTDGSGLREVGYHPPVLTMGVSNDASMVATTGSPYGNSAITLSVAATDGSGGPRLIAAGNPAYPVFSPDGSRLAFSDLHTGAVSTIGVDGTGLTPLPLSGVALGDWAMIPTKPRKKKRRLR